MAALRAGKHVYCEQPLGISTAEARAMHDLARSQGLRTVLGHQSHYEPAALQMAEMVRAGYIGQPLAFNHVYFGSNYIAPRPGHRQWLFHSRMGRHPGYRSGHNLGRGIAAPRIEISRTCTEMADPGWHRAKLRGPT